MAYRYFREYRTSSATRGSSDAARADMMECGVELGVLGGRVQCYSQLLRTSARSRCGPSHVSSAEEGPREGRSSEGLLVRL